MVEFQDKKEDAPNHEALASLLLAQIRQQIAAGFRKRDEAHLQSIFDQHKDAATNSILKPNLRAALEVLEIFVKEDEIDLLFFSMDRNDDQRIDFEEFKRAVYKPTPLEQWAQTVPLTQLLADSVPVRSGVDPLHTVSSLTSVEVEAMSIAFMEGFKRMLNESIQRLHKAFDAQESLAKHSLNRMASKFEVCAMSCGRIDDFHKGLSGRVGAPHMNFRKVMEAEHCSKAGSNTKFTSTNYQIAFTPRQEWEIIVEQKTDLADMRHGRMVPNIADLVNSPRARAANLADYEIIALVLYTGPMYMIYNAVLRRFPKEHFEPFEKGGNLFSSTIHALVSAVQKIARVTRLPSGLLLYRGLGGTVELPDFFFKGDEQGCRGFADWGFMSTTSSKTVAMQYSGVKEGKPLATVLEIRVGAVDRGACVRDFSQYPGEVEYLWVPCSFLEPVGTQYLEVTPEGVVTVIPIRVNANLKVLTADELVNQKKQMHLASFKYLLDEVERDLKAVAEQSNAQARLARDPSKDICKVKDPRIYSVETFLARIGEQCREAYERHANRRSEDYLNDEVYRGLVVDMLECKEMALSKLRWWIEDDTQFIRPNFDEALRAAHRGRIAFLQRTLECKQDRREACISLCKLKNLILESVREQNDLGEERIVTAAADGWSENNIMLLLEAGANVNAADATGETAIFKAARFGHVEVIRLLLAHGGDVGVAENVGRGTALHKAAMNNQVGAIRVLLEARANIEARSHDLRTPLHVASMLGHTRSVQALLEARADVSVVDDEAQGGLIRGSPLYKAARKCKVATVELLLEAKADVHFRSYKSQETSLHGGAREGCLGVVLALVAARADVNARDAEGRTPLDVAATEACKNTLEALGGVPGTEVPDCDEFLVTL